MLIEIRFLFIVYAFVRPLTNLLQLINDQVYQRISRTQLNYSMVGLCGVSKRVDNNIGCVFLVAIEVAASSSPRNFWKYFLVIKSFVYQYFGSVLMGAAKSKDRHGINSPSEINSDFLVWVLVWL